MNIAHQNYSELSFVTGYFSSPAYLFVFLEVHLWPFVFFVHYVLCKFSPVNFLSVFYIAFQNFVYTSYFLNFISLIKELRLTAIWTVFPSLPGVYFLSWYFPSLLPWEFPLSFSCVYGSTVSCTLDPHSLFLVFWNSMWYFLVWVYFLFVLSSTWAFLIWKLMSFRPGTLLNYFLLISLASPSYLVFYYLYFIYLVFYCLSCGAFIIWSSCCGTLSSSICHIFFLWLHFLWYFLNFIHQFCSWVFNFCHHILYIWNRIWPP